MSNQHWLCSPSKPDKFRYIKRITKSHCIWEGHFQHDPCGSRLILSQIVFTLDNPIWGSGLGLVFLPLQFLTTHGSPHGMLTGDAEWLLTMLPVHLYISTSHVRVAQKKPRPLNCIYMVQFVLQVLVNWFPQTGLVPTWLNSFSCILQTWRYKSQVLYRVCARAVCA